MRQFSHSEASIQPRTRLSKFGGDVTRLFIRLPNLAISAIPPALSEMGPYTSMVRAQTKVPSMPRAARAMPYMPAITCETQIVAPMQKHGMMQDLNSVY